MVVCKRQAGRIFGEKVVGSGPVRSYIHASVRHPATVADPQITLCRPVHTERRSIATRARARGPGATVMDPSPLVPGTLVWARIIYLLGEKSLCRSKQSLVSRPHSVYGPAAERTIDSFLRCRPLTSCGRRRLRACHTRSCARRRAGQCLRPQPAGWRRGSRKGLPPG